MLDHKGHKFEFIDVIEFVLFDHVYHSDVLLNSFWSDFVGSQFLNDMIDTIFLEGLADNIELGCHSFLDLSDSTLKIVTDLEPALN